MKEVINKLLSSITIDRIYDVVATSVALIAMIVSAGYLILSFVFSLRGDHTTGMMVASTIAATIGLVMSLFIYYIKSQVPNEK